MTASWVIQTLIIGCLAVIGYLLKDLKKGIEGKIGSAEERIQGLETRLDCKLDAFREEIEKNNCALESRLEERIKSNEQRYEALYKDLNDYKGQVNKNFTLKDDFIRAISGIDRKLDKIYDTLMENSRKGE